MEKQLDPLFLYAMKVSFEPVPQTLKPLTRWVLTLNYAVQSKVMYETDTIGSVLKWFFSHAERAQHQIAQQVRTSVVQGGLGKRSQ